VGRRVESPPCGVLSSVTRAGPPSDLWRALQHPSALPVPHIAILQVRHVPEGVITYITSAL
jgi:hypothetical protein